MSPIQCATAEDALSMQKVVMDIPTNVKDVLDEYPALKDIWLNPKLSRHQKKIRALPIMKKLGKEKIEVEARLSELGRKENSLITQREVHKKFKPWRVGVPILEKNDCSRLHLFATAMRDKRVILDQNDPLRELPLGEAWAPEVLKQYHSFVVSHDWASAFNNAQEYAGGIVKLPYEQCVFELRISGHTVFAMARQAEDEQPAIIPFVNIDDIWLMGSDDKIYIGDAPLGEPWIDFAVQQVKAISIALDAEVATHHVVRAPFKLNKHRERKGKIPLYDYHVVSLSNRARIANPAGGSSGTRRRLHFRRGHWRHYAEYKTWVRWTLVGNPELGFIDKEYRL